MATILSQRVAEAQEANDVISTGQRFASVFLQPPPHDDALYIGCILPAAGRIRDFHPLDRALAGHTAKLSREPSP